MNLKSRINRLEQKSAMTRELIAIFHQFGVQTLIECNPPIEQFDQYCDETVTRIKGLTAEEKERFADALDEFSIRYKLDCPKFFNMAEVQEAYLEDKQALRELWEDWQNNQGRKLSK